MLIFINETLQCPQRSLENLKKRVSHLHHPIIPPNVFGKLTLTRNLSF